MVRRHCRSTRSVAQSSQSLWEMVFGRDSYSSCLEAVRSHNHCSKRVKGMTQVVLGENEGIDSALRRFKRQVSKAGILAELITGTERPDVDAFVVRPNKGRRLNCHEALKRADIRACSFWRVNVGRFAVASCVALAQSIH